ncbi:MAG: C39 family peptidase [Promethearchaeota archaeon]
MQSKVTLLGIVFVTLLLLSFLPNLIPSVSSGTPEQFLTPSSPKDATYIEDIPYVWQEVNGFCHWSCLSMALQHLGLPLNLYDVFATTGVGFSAVYIHLGNTRIFVPGSNYRQLYQAHYLESFLGIDYLVMLDNTTEIGELLSFSMNVWNLDYEVITGATEAQTTLCHSLDSGYPLLLWVDPYYLPVHDYDILRQYNIHSADTGSGHAVLAIGYNDTSQHVWIMDPGVGALGDNVAYPSDGRWHYNISYDDLALAREPLAFGAIQLATQETIHSIPSAGYPEFIYQRLLGLPIAYELDSIHPSIVSCGARAFQKLSIDLSPQNLANYLAHLIQEELIIQTLIEQGIQLEQMLTLQYHSYRTALHQIQKFIPHRDLSAMIALGQAAFPHFEALSTNASLTTFDHTSYSSLIKDTMWGIAEAYGETGDIYESVQRFSNNLVEIQAHMNGIASSWKAAGDELQFQVNIILYTPILLVFFSSFFIAVIVILATIKIWKR